MKWLKTKHVQLLNLMARIKVKSRYEYLPLICDKKSKMKIYSNKMRIKGLSTSHLCSKAPPSQTLQVIIRMITIKGNRFMEWYQARWKQIMKKSRKSNNAKFRSLRSQWATPQLN